MPYNSMALQFLVSLVVFGFLGNQCAGKTFYFSYITESNRT